MFGKKKEQSVETNGIVYRRAKTWRVALAGCSSGIGMCFYVLLGLASYVANAGYGIATAVVGIILTATRILDGVTDPIIAIIIDKMNTRFGKIRILMGGRWADRVIGSPDHVLLGRAERDMESCCSCCSTACM